MDAGKLEGIEDGTVGAGRRNRIEEEGLGGGRRFGTVLGGQKRMRSHIPITIPNHFLPLSTHHYPFPTS